MCHPGLCELRENRAIVLGIYLGLYMVRLVKSEEEITYHLESSWMPLHDTVGVKGKKGATTDIKAKVPGMWAKGCMLHNCASLSDLT